MTGPVKPDEKKSKGKEKAAEVSSESSSTESPEAASGGELAKRDGDGHSAWDVRGWPNQANDALKRVEESVPGVVPVTVGAGALAAVGAVTWPVALGGVGLYGLYQWWRSGAPSPHLPLRS